MDRRPLSNSTPTFKMELAKLCRLSSSDPQARPVTQYPSVDFSYYNAARSQSAPTTSTPSFIPVAARIGSKRIRVRGLNHVASASPSIERLQLGTENGRNPTVFNSELYDVHVALLAGVNWKPAVPEPEQDPPEMSDDDDEDESEDSNGSYDEPESDPYNVLGSNLFHHTLSFLDYKSLARCCAVSAAWQRCAQDDSLWDYACRQLWYGKIHIHPTALDPSTPRLRAFQISVADSKRTSIETRDLCSFIWKLRFKEHTGEYWKQLDPYYRGLPLLRRIFHTDGHITAEPIDEIFDGHESSWTLRRPKSNGGPPRVRINHWPPVITSRTPEWGWVMENAWVAYTSTSELVTSKSAENFMNFMPSRMAANDDIRRRLHAVGSTV